MAKHLDTIYVSGWQYSATHTMSNEPSPNLADYFYETVRNKPKAAGTNRGSAPAVETE
ncbi:hypothetical protein JHK82_031058 [Glycine max]|nr:hypothetical protein JHK85_031703 [Glycine max]KAG4994326.1 hypothetical protein JHK86_031153 [Glycine max]KAG5124321.1 hypothetical protein JHK82_031058 [Glycine max]KAG5145740.1 hypothetical protein JHK84_031283 [Glycine max]